MSEKITSDEAFENWFETEGKDGVRLDGKDAWNAALEWAKGWQEQPYLWVHVDRYGCHSAPSIEQWAKESVASFGGSMFPLYTHAAPAQPVVVQQLVEKAQAVVDRWDSVDWKTPHTGHFINELRVSIKAARGVFDE